jgi:membrane fusion protein (multidrug efflux system)
MMLLADAVPRRLVRVVLMITAFPLGLAACSKAEQPPAPPQEVSVVAVQRASLPLNLSYTARVRGEREVEVRARVSGILEKRFYKEGAPVKAGDLMFRIDPRPFEAAVRSAQGQLGIAKAQLEEAELQIARVEQLKKQGLVSMRERDLAQAAYSSAKAAVDSAQANLDAAKLQLAWTEVRAPVSGVTGEEARSEGSLVNADDDTSLLTTISQPERLYVDFTMPESEARLVREALAANPDSVKVRLKPQGGAPLPELAAIDFLDPRVDADTGTVAVRATISNEQNNLSPGQFVRASLEGLSSAEGMYVPGRAVLYGSDGPFVWKVDEKNVVQFAPIRLSPGQGDLLRADEGLTDGDRVIVDGVLKVTPGAVVTPIVVDLHARPATALANADAGAAGT